MRVFRYILPLIVLLGMTATATSQDLAAGEELFLNQCAQCHNRNMKDDLTGPALGGAAANWDSEEELYAWIRNSQALIASGSSKRATQLWKDWGPTVMNGFPNFTDEQISNVLGYIDGVHTGTYGVPAGGDAAVGGAVADEGNNMPFYLMMLFLLAMLALILVRVSSNLKNIAAIQEGEDVEPKTLVDVLTSPGVIGFLIFGLVVIGGYTTVNKAIELGRQQNYQPEQPIKFSHKLHAGDNGIDCQYCHDGARRSKQSVIPATNTCMNCHKAVKKGPTTGTAEITKIYASIGFDPNTDKYIDNYDNLSEAELEKIFKQWIADTYQKENASRVDAEGAAKIANEAEKTANEQWNEIKTSLTNENKEKIQGPIEWIRIHNMPDHVYFNHSQHVTVGKQECQTCHGKVEEMEVVSQYAPLSMGWCVNCHRQTAVQFDDNEYYEAYQHFHEELESGERKEVTVEDIGGLGCQKCHY